jgi:hypothetical protein
MGQKTNPIGFRLGISKDWRSKYYAGRDLPALLREDELLRKYLKARLGHAAIADVVIERKPGKVVVTLHTGRPGVVIGKKGAEVDKLSDAEVNVLTTPTHGYLWFSVCEASHAAGGDIPDWASRGTWAARIACPTQQVRRARSQDRRVLQHGGSARARNVGGRSRGRPRRALGARLISGVSGGGVLRVVSE